ncbi:MAG: hypothetical protein RLZZ303_1280 [Candidatus Hydrogenedentota bacterium]|jgi:hypothetical protein
MPSAESSPGANTPRPWIGMHWKCCHVYSRVYLNHAETHFAGNCPRCGAPVRLRAVRGAGSEERFWTAE